MKKVIEILFLIIMLITILFCTTGCSSSSTSLDNSNMCELCHRKPKTLGKFCDSCNEGFFEWQKNK